MSQKIKIAFLTILGLMLINCSNVFATNLTLNNIEKIMYEWKGFELNQTQKQNIQELINNSEYTTIYITNTSSELRIFGTQNKPYVSGIANNRYSFNVNGTARKTYRISIYANGEYEYTSTSNNAIVNAPVEIDNFADFIFLPDGANNEIDSYDFYPGWKNYDIDLRNYLEPYFIFSASKVGTTTIENYEGNIPCYYTTSFPRWSNSYSTNREIGSLYIDKNYILEDIFYPAIYINKYNWEQTKEWNYTGYQFFKEEEVDNYLRYSISIENNLLTAPYFYNLNLKSINKNLSEDLNINFGVINKPNTGGTITDNSGDTISGDEIKDNTTPGDINNTLEEIFQEPDEEELKKQQEENINEIKEQITNELNNNEVFGALTTAEQGLIEILEGEPRRF